MGLRMPACMVHGYVRTLGHMYIHTYVNAVDNMNPWAGVHAVVSNVQYMHTYI